MNDTITNDPITHRQHVRRRDAGHTLLGTAVFAVIVIAVLGTGIALVFDGIRTHAAGTACDSDLRALTTATDRYFADARLDEIPAAGTGDDRFEQTLIDTGYLRSPSAHYHVTADGTAVPKGNSPC